MKKSFPFFVAVLSTAAPHAARADVQKYYNFGLDGSLFGSSFSSYLSFDDEGFSSGNANLYGDRFRASAGDIGADWNSLSLSNRSFQGVQATVPSGRFQFTGIAGQTQIATSLADIVNQPIGLFRAPNRVISSSVYGLRSSYNFNRAFSLSASQLLTPDSSRIEGASISSLALLYAPNRFNRIELEGARSSGGQGYQIGGFRNTGKLNIGASYRRADPNFSTAGNLLLRTNRTGHFLQAGYRFDPELQILGTTYRYGDGFGGRSRFDSISLGLNAPDERDRPNRPILLDLTYQKRALEQSILIGGTTQRYSGPGVRISGGDTGRVRLLFNYDRLNFQSSTSPDTKNDRFGLSAFAPLSQNSRLTFYGTLNFADLQGADTARGGDRRDLLTGFLLDTNLRRGYSGRVGLERQQSRYAGDGASAYAARIGFELPLGQNGRRAGLEYRKGFGGNSFLRDTYNDALFLSYRQNISLGSRPTQFSPSQLSQEERLNLGRITARVFEDANLNGCFDAGEIGVPNIVVALTDELRTRTGARGDLRFPALPANTYRLRLIVPSLPIELTQLSDSDREITLAPRQNQVVDFPVSRTGIISGTVFLDANRNGARDAGEVGIRDAIVRLSDSEIVTFSGEDGTFTLFNVPPGQKTLSLDTQLLPAAGYDVTTPVAPFILAPGGAAPAQLLGLAPREAPIIMGQVPPSIAVPIGPTDAALVVPTPDRSASPPAAGG